MSEAADDDSETSRPSGGVDFLEDFFRRTGLQFGEADLFLVGPTRWARIAKAIHVLLVGFARPDGSPAVGRALVVLPPEGDPVAVKERLTSEVEALMATMRGRGLDPEEVAALERRLSVTASEDGELSTLRAVVSGAPAESVVIVMEAARYRGSGVRSPTTEGTRRLFPEDLWVPHLTETARLLTEAAREVDAYIVLDAGEFQPARREAVDLLISVDNCGVVCASPQDDPLAMVADHADAWAEQVAEGRLGNVLAEIGSISGLDAASRALLRIDTLHRSGLERMAAAEVEALAPKVFNDPGVVARLARIALQGGRSATATRLLRAGFDRFRSREDLELALDAAAEMPDRNLELGLADRLRATFPRSSRLRQWDVDEALGERRYEDAARILAADDGDREVAAFYGEVARVLRPDGAPDYDGILRELSRFDSAWNRCTVDILTRDALDRGLLREALELAVPSDEMPQTASASPLIILDALQAVLLRRTEAAGVSVPLEHLLAALMAVLRHLGSEPRDVDVRGRVFRVLSPSIGGDLGRILMVEAAFRFGEAARIGARRRPRRTVPIEWLEEHGQQIEDLIRWMGKESPLVPGRVRVPRKFLTEPPEDVLAGLTRIVVYEARHSARNDPEHLVRMAALAAAVAPLTVTPEEDIRLLRVAAEALAVAGLGQMARDLVEGLLDAASTPGRIRASWCAMADVYARVGDPLEALLALGCALSEGEEVDEETAWLEVTLLVRLLRDIGLSEIALRFVARIRGAFDGTEVLRNNASRLDLMDAQIRHFLLGSQNPDPQALSAVLDCIVAAAQGAVDAEDDTLPAALTLGQAMRDVTLAGIAVPPEAGPLLDKLLERCSPASADLVRTMTTTSPTADEVLGLTRGGAFTRYAEDVAFDIRDASMMARRLLGDVATSASPEVAAFAVEMLADLSVATPGWDVEAAPAPLPASVGEPGAIACDLSRSAAEVVMLGMRPDGRLLQVSTREGRLLVPAPIGKSGLNYEALRAWSARFPYAYASEADPNVFFGSTEGFTLSDLPDGPLLFVADTGLQCFPPQLFRSEDRFLGWDRALATVPSLCWLRTARSAPVRREARSVAWIPTAEGPEGDRTLAVMAGWLSEDFERHGVALRTEAEVPDGMRGVELAIVGAHGGVVREGSYFQTITDDASMRLPGARLANGLRNAGVVVLFVCSGGRADPHPSAHTVVGLAKHLLNAGCSAVVGSPWPLDPRVTIRWLPEFLDRWADGDRLMDAVFAANRRVDAAWPYDPRRSLALGVCGNPFVRRTNTAREG